MSIIYFLKNIFKLDVNYNNRIFGLDLMRTIAILIVIIQHSLMLEKADTNFPWIPLLDGVELFFVLSGFLIGRILIKIFNNENKLGVRVIWNFWIRRWFRTLPNYYLVLILNIIVGYYGIINEDFALFNWKFFFFLQNFNEPLLGFFLESWSLSVEEWFYLLFPIILGVLFILLYKLRVNKKKIFLISILVFLFTPLLFRFFIASDYNVDRFWFSVKIAKVVIFRLDGIAFGLLAAFVNYYYSKSWYKYRNITFVIGGVFSYGILLYSWDLNSTFAKVLLFFVQSLSYALLLPKFESMRRKTNHIVKIVTHISLISYSMYLINLALIAEVIRDNFPPQNPLTAWIMFFVYLLAVFVFSTLIYKYYEKPIMNLRDKWSNKRIKNK